MNFDEIYRDQAIYQISTPGYHVLTAYTPEGIRKLDSLFCQRILAFRRNKPYIEYSWSYWSPLSDEPKRPPVKVVEKIYNDTKKTLKKDIRNNPHLHPIIKENLLYNLNS